MNDIILPILDFIQHQAIPLIAGAVGGLFMSVVSKAWLNKRGTFTYTVNHQRIGFSSNNSTFGNVTVSWNGTQLPNLFISTIEMKNESLNDYENIIINACTADTNLLTEQTQLGGTPNILKWSDNFQELMHISEGQSHSPTQMEIYSGQREYLIPVLNRGQSVRLSFLNSAKSTATPSIWLSVLQKGIRLKLRSPQTEHFGVAHPIAATVGVASGLVVIPLIMQTNLDADYIIALAYVYGLAVIVPGAFIVRAYRRARDFIGG